MGQQLKKIRKRIRRSAYLARCKEKARAAIAKSNKKK